MTESMRPISPPLPPDPRSATSQPPSPPKREQDTRERIRQRSTSRNGRSRTASSASATRPIIHQPQPIRDAVDKAFDQSIDQSPTTSQLDPAFIAQVTEAVVKNLMTTNLSSQQSSVYPPPPPPATLPHPQSPTQSSVTSQPERYTPPSPAKERAKPVSAETSQRTNRNSITQDNDSQFAANSERLRRPRGESDANSQRRQRESISSNRPSQETFAQPSNEEGDVTTLEKIWQPLFDKSGNPLPRVGQFLRGLALHLIDDYEPKGSLVVTPAKMMRFFEETRLKEEIYPWRTIFGGSIGNASVSVMYRRLLCQHHLVQIANHESPNVPGLTPLGFEWFMTCLMQAHPDAEFDRLTTAVKHMPISNADDRKERFPKELSRRLLPQRPNPQAEQRLIASLAHEPAVQLKNSTAMPPPPPSFPLSSSFQERERMPYARSSHSDAVDDDDLNMPSVQIERERKPYVAREGGGKQYETDSERRDSSPASFGRVSEPPPRPIRQSSYSSVGAPDPRALPSRNRLSTGPGTVPPVSYNNFAKPSGRRSPPIGSYARSEPGNLSDIPPSQFSSNLPSARASSEYDDDRRLPPRRRDTNTAPPSVIDDGPRGKPIPPRTGPGGSVDSGYGSMGMPPPLQPVSTNTPRQRNSQSSYDDTRRRSAYSAGPASGTDSWNTFSNGYPPQQSYGNSSSVGN